jgi:hypothetical protein
VRAVVYFLLLLFASPPSNAAGFDGGHTKLAWLATSYPDDSVFQSVLGDHTHDQNGELRLKFSAGEGPWNVRADYQLIARFGDSLALAGQPGSIFYLPPAVPDDEFRLMDLTHEIDASDDRIIVQRLDRLHLDYVGEKTVLRIGRQAVSWGNGLIYNPMDVFNPFDPAAVDTEYKIGDDMVYGQYLTDSGSDWQFVEVVRRNREGDLAQDVNSTALKFHGFGGDKEYDLLLSQHYGELLLGVGGSSSLGGAVIRGDITVTDTDDGWVTSLVANWSYSWVWGGRNVSAVAEYFYSGFGLKGSDYSIADIEADQELIERIARGELFTLGRHYVAVSMLVEMTPLFTLTPNIFVNADDGSALVQVVAQWSFRQDWQLLASLNVPVGPDGSEYGGLETGVEGLTLASGPAVFTQLAWYF